jgi:hypothetical protein
MSTICATCIDDPYLSSRIEADGEPSECAVCNRLRQKTYDLETLANAISGVIRHHFETGDDYPRFYGDDDQPQFEQQGDTLDLIVSRVLGQDLDFIDELVDAIIDGEYGTGPSALSSSVRT